MSGGGGGCGGGGHVVGARINPAYYKIAAQTIETELRERGIEPQVPLDGESSMREKQCDCSGQIVITAVITALICTVIFMFIWEIT